jgi:hypothetical protein
MPRNQTEDATINDVVAHIVLTKRGAFARCGRCGSPLVKITNTSQIVLIGYTFDGRIWCETADRRATRAGPKGGGHWPNLGGRPATRATQRLWPLRE